MTAAKSMPRPTRRPCLQEELELVNSSEEKLLNGTLCGIFQDSNEAGSLSLGATLSET